MTKLLSRMFNLYCQKRWLILINKELDKYNKMKVKLSVQEYSLKVLIKRYNELFDGDIRFGNSEVNDG